MSDSNTSDEVETLYRSLRTRLVHYASRFFTKPQEIEDVVQEAFIRVIEAKNARGISVNASYLYRTTRNIAFNTKDKLSYRLTDTIGDDTPESVLLETPTLEQSYESNQRFELFCESVRQLPLKCQRVFILRRVYGLTHKEISDRLDISPKTVEAHLTKAIMRCTEYMTEYERQDENQSNRRKASS